MNESQLTILENSFKSDNIWELKEATTAIKQSTLFHQVSELVKQELSEYLNGGNVNVKLMQEHANYINKKLAEDKESYHYGSVKAFNQDLKNELLQAVAWLLKNQEISSDNVAHLEALNERLTKSDNAILVVKDLTQDIIQQFPQALAEYLNKIQYYRANRFKNSLKSLLEDVSGVDIENIKRVQQLKNTPIYQLASSVMNDEEELYHIFRMHKQPIPKTNWSIQPYLKICYQLPQQCMKTLYNGGASIYHGGAYCLNKFSRKKTTESEVKMEKSSQLNHP